MNYTDPSGHEILSKIKSAAKKVATTVKNTYNKAKTWVKNTYNKSKNWVSNTYQNAKKALTNANYAQTECQFRYCGTAIPFLTVRSTAR